MSLNLFLLRHGETEASYTGGYCGRSDPDLTPIGHQMAEDFAKAYQPHPFHAVYVSPMLRTRMTAQPLCATSARVRWFRPVALCASASVND